MSLTKPLASLQFIAYLLISTSLWLIAAPAAANKPLDINVFTKLSAARQVVISPDGKHIATVFKRGEEDMLAIIKVDGMKPVTVVKAFGKRKQIAYVQWANDERLLYRIMASESWDKQQYLTNQTIGVNIDGKKHFQVLGYGTLDRKGRELGVIGTYQLIDILPDDEKHVLAALYPWKVSAGTYVLDKEADPIIYKANIYRPRLSRVTNLPYPQASGFVDNNKDVRLSFGIDEDNELVIHHRKTSKSKWQPLELNGLADSTNLSFYGFSEDNNKVYLGVSHEKGPDSLQLYDLVNHSTKELFRHEKADIDKAVRNTKGNKIVAVGFEHGYFEYVLLDGKDKVSKMHSKILKMFPGYNVQMTSSSDNGERAVFRVFSGFQPSVYYLYDEKTDKFSFLMASRQWIDSKLMADREPVQFKSRDGLELNGYLTRPIGKKESLPTIIYPHGGPHGVKDKWRFEWDTQLLVNRGYAVLQLNFRGSSGYGHAFQKAGYGQWGAAMQDDLTDATLQLIEQGIADKNRICIYGASYGGYAALMGVIREPDLYQCAIGSMGVYDIPMLFTEGDIPDSRSGIGYLKRVLGEDTAKQKQYSPAYNTDKIKVPLLLIHGMQDQRTPIEQFEALEDALKKNNKQYQKLILSKDGHGYGDVESRNLVYTEILSFLDKHIGK